MDDLGRAGRRPARAEVGGELMAEEGAASGVQSPPAVPPPGPAPRSRSRLRGPLFLLGVLVLIGGGVLAYLHGGRLQTTEDAALQAAQVSVSANVGGQVVAVEVHENQPVRAGQVLFRIDPRPFQAAVDQAQAQLADATTQVEARRAGLRQGQAEISAAQARLNYAVAEAAREKSLLAEGIASQNQYDQAALNVQTARLAVATSTEQAAGVRAQLAGGADTPTDRQPAVQAAQATLERARLELGYTVVRAPQDGVATRVNQFQVGDTVTPSKPVFTLVGRRVWVEAEFKENQLRYMRVGQPAAVEVDAFPGRRLSAQVTSFSPGTGSSFSLLPAENATGNWVKVVQRLPVQLDLVHPPTDLPLHAGLSARVSVDTGHRRRLFAGSAPAQP